MMRQGRAFSLVVGWLLGIAAPAIAGTGQDVRSCYAFSDTFPPVAANAPDVNFVDISTIGTPLTLSDDTPSSPIPLPFTFEFFDHAYSAVTVSPNGFLTFESPSDAGGCQCSGTRLPDAREPNLRWTWQHVEDALRDLQFGSVILIVQHGVVVQVDRTERQRYQRFTRTPN